MNKMLIFIVLLYGYSRACSAFCNAANDLVCLDRFGCLPLHSANQACNDFSQICRPPLGCLNHLCRDLRVIEREGATLGEPCDTNNNFCRAGLSCISRQYVDLINGGAKGGPGDFDNCTTTEDCGLNEVCQNGLCHLITSNHISSALIIVVIFILVLLLAIISTLISICRKQKGNLRVTVVI